MKKLILYILFFSIVSSSYSQSYLNITNFIYGQSLYNPAYSASYKSINGLLLYRNQFVGIKGGPQTIAFNLQYPLNTKNLVAGITAFNQQIGMKNQTNVFANINYRVNFSEKQSLLIGIKAGVVNYNFNKADALFSDDIDDPFFNHGTESYMLPDIGFGLFYFSNKFFAGLSLPQLYSTKFDVNSFKYHSSGFNLSEINTFLYGGYIFVLNNEFTLKPSLLLKYEYGVSFQPEINAQVIYKSKIGIGLGYRSNESVIFMLKYLITDKLYLGYSYDYIFNELNNYSSGSHEITLSFSINKKVSNSMFGSIRSF